MIYLDNGAATRMRDGVLEAMLPYLKEEYENPFGRSALNRSCGAAVEKARRRIAALVNADYKEIYFTSGGTESDNWVIKQLLDPGKLQEDEWGNRHFSGHLIVSAVEHHAVLKPAEFLAKVGFDLTVVPVDGNGRVDPEEVRKAVRQDTRLVSVMLANNEIGTIEPVREIADIAHAAGALMHTDAVQAVGHIPVDVKELQVDFLSASGHKFGGPKGTGFLYIRRGLLPEPLMHGGAQERGLRAGTHNVPGISGMGMAAELAAQNMEEDRHYEQKLRDYMTKRILQEIPGSTLNGDPEKRLPGNCNVTIPGLDNEMALVRLDQEGICAAAGSACSAGAPEPSHVLKAIGRTDEEAGCSFRFTLNYRNTKDEIDKTCDVLKKIAEECRKEQR
ncbi:MAG: cysteine desulfurase family protein [Eubacterium sp.]